MIWVFLVGFVVWASAPIWLSWLPPPQAAPAECYSALNVPRFHWTNGAAIVAASCLVAAFVPPELRLSWATISSVTVSAAVIDFNIRFLPTPLLLIAGVGLGFGTPSTSQLVTGLAGAALWALIYLTVWRFGAGLGFGDVRLAGILGFATGQISISTTVTAMIVASLVAVLWGLRHPVFAFGPHLVFGALVAPGLLKVPLG